MDPRTYLVGASLTVTVADDGTVSYTVYFEDAGVDVANEGATPQDVTAVEAALQQRGTSHTF